MFRYLSKGMRAGAPLVVVLHGCGQTASGYDAGTGWSALAAELGFAVLAPEQKAVNNPNTCFNWFNPEDITRGEGECASIAAMIRTMIDEHKLDGRRVFITGLSAGGAMTAAMLATYPELFAGGAIIAGLPFGVAANVRDALEAMRAAPLRTPHQWGDAVRAASGYAGLWPKISIWHGALDTTVNISNAQASVAQWADVLGLSLAAAKQELVDGVIRLSWGNRLEVYTVPTLGHGTPIDSGDLGSPAPFILEAAISSTRRIAGFWSLVPRAAAKPAPVRIVTEPALPAIEAVLAPRQAPQPVAETLVRRALRAVGLLKR
ncbi:MAG TPA: PHB depolymerase family esterase [Rhizomicrobium sp.]|jgi:poly(hydroxyalkanoate) depolymerase family esterase|nr:PHB depolymerase family esterase [Rhizomicrobium sp.]